MFQEKKNARYVAHFCFLVLSRQGKKGDLDKPYRIDKDLAAAEAKRLIAMEKRQEDDAYLLSREYDDDYDDQVSCDARRALGSGCDLTAVVVVVVVLLVLVW